MRMLLYLACLFVTLGSFAQSADSPARKQAEEDIKAHLMPVLSPEKPMAVTLEILVNGDTVHNGATLDAPVDINVIPWISTATAAHAGDYIMVYLSANTNELWSGKFEWQDKLKPNPILPLERPAGFFGGWFTWSNVPPGSYSITARTSEWHDFSALSPLMHITITPPK
jgi:hypothetical protein